MKNSAITLLFLAIGSISLLLFSSYQSAAASSTLIQMPAEPVKVKCSNCCKKAPAPLPWSIVSPAMY